MAKVVTENDIGTGLEIVSNKLRAKNEINSATQSALDGKADLVGGLIPANQLPSFVDDVLEFANLSSFPATGEAGKIYVALDTNKVFRWSGATYIEVSQGLTFIDSAMVLAALGYTPYNSSNPAGYLSSVAWSIITGKPSFAAVATSGNYNDLSNKPTIPTNTNQLANGAGFITGYTETDTFQSVTNRGASTSNNITAAGFFQSSDERLKDIVKKDGDVIYYKWKDLRDDKLHAGYSAQEVQKINPEQVNEDDKGYLSVNYVEVLVEKMLKLEQKVEALTLKLKENGLE